jgi:hypothetical protein
MQLDLRKSQPERNFRIGQEKGNTWDMPWVSFVWLKNESMSICNVDCDFINRLSVFVLCIIELI